MSFQAKTAPKRIQASAAKQEALARREEREAARQVRNGILCQCSDEGCKTRVYGIDPFFSSPCGTFCTVDMLKHAKVCGVCNYEMRKHFPEMNFAAVKEWKQRRSEV